MPLRLCPPQITTEGATTADSRMKEALLKLGTPVFREKARACGVCVGADGEQPPSSLVGARGFWGWHQGMSDLPTPQVRQWVKDMAAGGPGGEGPAGGGEAQGGGEGGAGAKKARDAAEKEREAAAAKAAAKAKEEKGPTRTIEVTERCARQGASASLRLKRAVKASTFGNMHRCTLPEVRCSPGSAAGSTAALATSLSRSRTP